MNGILLFYESLICLSLTLFTEGNKNAFQRSQCSYELCLIIQTLIVIYLLCATHTTILQPHTLCATHVTS